MYRRMDRSALQAASHLRSRACGSFPLQEALVPDTLAPASAATVLPSSLAARVLGVLASPREIYAAVAARPRWLGAFLVVLVVNAAAAAIFSATEVGQRAIVDQQINWMEASGRRLTDAQMQTLEGMRPYFTYLA